MDQDSRVQRDLGTLIEQGRGVAHELAEFKAEVRKDLSEIKKEVRANRDFKMRVLGFAAFAAFIATMVAEFARAVIR